jgi:Ca2+-binding RTX toxin-like protein
MSFHFLNRVVYGPFTDTEPGTIIVDPLATIISFNSFDALGLASGAWDVTISGLIVGADRALSFSDAGAFVSNVKVKAGGEILGGSYGILANHATNIVNAGHIWASTNYGIWEAGPGDLFIKNLKGGVIEGGSAAIVASGLGTHTILNVGTIADAILGGDGVEKVTNIGKIDGFAYIVGVDLGDGADIFTDFKKVGHVVKHGTVAAIIDLGAGGDTFNGGKHNEIVRDNAGSDTYNLGGGNDLFVAQHTSTDGSDIVNGGSGFDSYSAPLGLANSFVTINLDSVAHFNIAAHSAELVVNGSSSIDSLTGFEQISGTEGADVLIGSKGADKLLGNSGQNTIVGLVGADTLIGGGDSDSFLYTSLKDSGLTKATRDTIIGFGDGSDLIDLQSINQDFGNTFHFVGNDVAFDGSDGAILAVKGNGVTIVKLDVDGDKVADFSIEFSELITFRRQIFNCEATLLRTRRSHSDLALNIRFGSKAEMGLPDGGQPA